MTLNSSQIIDKFKKYGFEYKKHFSNKTYLTFTFKSGFFHNAEVIQVGNCLEDQKDIDKKLISLERLGVSIKRNKYDSIEDIEVGLFDGFFDVKEWKGKIIDDYNDHSNKVLKAFPDKNTAYKYINSPYTINGQNNDSGLTIAEHIINGLNKKGAQLILIEAPAGFGKTCTSFEIIKKMVERQDMPVPFFTEFSRDRQARVFNHVFIREVDRTFKQVKSEVVIDEVQNGKITMVLDGFDELLSDNNKTDNPDDYENAEPMLETIGELLTKNAKIILTSRRSAIFDGSVFNEWLDRYSNFSFDRYRIASPKIDDWLEYERQELLIKAGIQINQLSNPVLLSYLSVLTKNSFKTICDSPSEIVSHYFLSMLEREQERQNLPMTPEEQTELMMVVAGDMCDKDYTSDTKDKLIELFKTKCLHLLEKTRKNYLSKERPTLDSLANTLATHAFFDRSNQGENRIEFINEFVFGNYIAENILNHQGDWISHDERFVEPAIASYACRTNTEKLRLWDKLHLMRSFLSASDKMKFETLMLNEVGFSNYSNSSINSLIIENLQLTFQRKINESVFIECSFSKVNFNLNQMKNITFLNCKFYDCSFLECINIDPEIVFLNCISNNRFITDIERLVGDENITNKLDLVSKFILEKFLPIGSNSIDRLHIPLVSLYKIKVQGIIKSDIVKAIKRLKRNGILTEAQHTSYIAIDKTKIPEIKNLLGRV